MIEFRQMSAGDLTWVINNLRNTDMHAMLSSAGVWAPTEFVREKLANDVAGWSMRVNDVAVACGGFQFHAGHCATAWFLATPEWSPHWLSAVRRIRRAVDVVISDPKMTRVQATTFPEFEQGCRLLEFVGMQREGVLRRAGCNGENLALYARVK